MNEFHFGEWDPAMSDVIRPYVEGRVVWDLGAGMLGQSRRLVRLGAQHVMAVDKSPLGFPGSKEPITFTRSLFAEVEVPAEGIEVALLAWPVNYPTPGLVEILERTATVIYLGSNVNGSACGSRALWGYLAMRDRLEYVPRSRNSLIVYGRHLERGETRLLVGEEVAATSREMLTFQEAEELSVATRGA